MWQSDRGRVAAPAQPSLLELALGDHALVVVEQRVDLLAVDDGGLVDEVAQEAVETPFAAAVRLDAGGHQAGDVAEAVEQRILVAEGQGIVDIVRKLIDRCLVVADFVYRRGTAAAVYVGRASCRERVGPYW